MINIKRLIAMLLTVALCLAGAALAEPDAGDPVAALEGIWINGDATLFVDVLDEGITCTVIWNMSETGASQWVYEDCQFDEVTGGLSTFETGLRIDLKFEANGDVESVEEVYRDGAATFEPDGEGGLVWTDFKKTPGENQVAFIREENASFTPSAEELADDYLRVIAAVEEGTAGSSLKCAKAAAEAAVFAANYGLWDPDDEALDANLREAWESLTPEEQAGFDANFEGVVGMLDHCLNDWEGARPLFDDAGVGVLMEMIVFDPLNRLAWENLCAHTRALGVDDGGEVSSDGLHASIQHAAPSPDWVVNLPAAQDADQMFVVAGLGMDKTTATISMHEKGEDGSWTQILSTPGFVGLNGLCADADHAEGCAQTPIGVYRFNKAFGIAPDPGCALPYIQVDDSVYWSGDEARHYNEMIRIEDEPELDMTNSEHIVDYEYQYQYCLNISFNEEGAPGRGSAIFLHCFGPAKPYTGGCVAIPENLMRMVMQRVREDCVVVIDTLENMGGSF